MTILTPPVHLTPEDEIEPRRIAMRSCTNLIDGELKEKTVGMRSLFIASRICDRLNSLYYPQVGAAAVETMIYCFDQARPRSKAGCCLHSFRATPNARIPEGDLHVAPNLVVEVLSPGNSGIEVEEKLNEYLGARHSDGLDRQSGGSDDPRLPSGWHYSTLPHVGGCDRK